MVDFREAKASDCELYDKWTQEQGVRDFAFNKDAITYERHSQWFHEKISTLSCLLLVALDNGVPCGQIRFDCNDNVALISFSVALAYRGKGLSSKLLTQGAVLCRDRFGRDVLVEGVVMEDNLVSMRAFAAAGYQAVQRFERGGFLCVRFQAPLG